VGAVTRRAIRVGGNPNSELFRGAMATGLLALLDDISGLADGVASLTAAAARKSTGLVTDDMAVTAEQAVGIRREREIPVVLAVARGSMRNKALILTPAALVLNAVAPWAITPLLMAGGTFLAYEGFEKVLHGTAKATAEAAGDDPIPDPEAYEAARIAGAIRTDFILSAEIIVISLGEVAAAPFVSQVITLYLIAVLMTVGVYGVVGVLVKLDDFGEYLCRSSGFRSRLGDAIVRGTPWLMKTISVVGTAAMLVVGGHILIEGIPPLHHLEVEFLLDRPLAWLWSSLAGLAVGAAVGAVATGLVTAWGRMWRRARR
jgi:predicted DNA repair protein MutK